MTAWLPPSGGRMRLPWNSAQCPAPRGVFRLHRGIFRLKPEATGRVILLTIIAACAAGCTSPESRRTRGGGQGADRGNRPAAVKMHDGSDPFWNTPERIGKEHPPLDPARQAKRLDQ